MNKLFGAVLWRAIRGAVATGLATWWAAHQADPRYIWAVPVLLALGKALRDKWPGKFDWIPF